jgi:hypothetical protein
MNFPPIKIVHKPDGQRAHNGPLGVTIETGTRYFAAVLLQEVYEGARQMAWMWLPFFAIIGGAFAIGRPADSLAAIAWLILISAEVVPLRYARERRELMGQAIEIAAIRLFYKREDMDSEYYLQARSMIRQDSSYISKGFWKKIGTIDPAVYTAFDAVNTKPNPTVDKMVRLLRSVAPKAESYVRKKRNWKKLEKWRSLGAESRGY